MCVDCVRVFDLHVRMESVQLEYIKEEFCLSYSDQEKGDH